MIYDYQCDKCLHKLIDVYVRRMDERVDCPKCENEMTRLFPVDSRFKPYVFPADGIHLEHVSATGKTFYSKKEMRDYAKKHDLELGAL